MWKIVSAVLFIIMIWAGVVFVRQWNSTTPWGVGTGTIPREKSGSAAMIMPQRWVG